MNSLFVMFVITIGNITFTATTGISRLIDTFRLSLSSGLLSAIPIGNSRRSFMSAAKFADDCSRCLLFSTTRGWRERRVENESRDFYRSQRSKFSM